MTTFTAMQKCGLFVFGCLFFFHSLSAQNLVPNPGFDDLTACIDSSNQLNLAYPWEASYLSPDLFNECSNNLNQRVPHPHRCEYLQPHSGTGFAGALVLNNGHNEILQVKLIEPLKQGQQYSIGLYVAPDEDCNLNGVQTFTDAVGMAFVEDTFSVIAFQNSGEVIKDTANWTRLSACFTGVRGDSILRVGNFAQPWQIRLETNSPGMPYYFNYMYFDDVFVIPFNPLPDTLFICDDQPIRLGTSFPGAVNYFWNNGDRDSIIQVNETGDYMVKANMGTCYLYDTVHVFKLPDWQSNPPDAILCKNRSLTISLADMPGTYEWSDGFTGAEHPITTPGEYQATVTNACGTFPFYQTVLSSECKCKYYAPTAFSPNGDDINDSFEVFMKCEHFNIHFHQFEIFDRWGDKVYATSDYPFVPWDGLVNGKPAIQGVYTWVLSYDVLTTGHIDTIVEKGDVGLIR
ncbi:MAG TPA: gliding motility-associated C-terminal domain-containing protein [Saprospiraceae bacterium]|nr:gliding motility-associated C-terminal domain-containing protein [Saprospiraceae bacterium]